MLSIRRYDIAT